MKLLRHSTLNSGGGACRPRGRPRRDGLRTWLRTSFRGEAGPDMTGFLALCQTHLSREESESLCGWTVLVPFSLDEEIWLPIESDDHKSMVASAPQVLPLAEKLAAASRNPGNMRQPRPEHVVQIPSKGTGRYSNRTVGQGPGHSLLRRTVPTRCTALNPTRLPHRLHLRSFRSRWAPSEDHPPCTCHGKRPEPKLS